VQLIAVSKKRPSSEIEFLYQQGQRDFGENQVQELKQKALELSHLTEIRWHMIGHLQTNKVNDLLKIKNLYAIHSVDSLKLVNLLASKTLQHPIKLFLQAHISDEDEKYGFETREELQAAIKTISSHPHFQLVGLMGMAPIRIGDGESKKSAAANSFQKLNDIKSGLISAEISKNFFESTIELSMGMSDDFAVAIEAGSTFVRLGSILFDG
jgi:pyridoxal phosphate enzyme (YggS family)